MLYIGPFIIVNGQNINFFEKFSFLTYRGWKTASAVCACQMPLNRLRQN